MTFLKRQRMSVAEQTFNRIVDEIIMRSMDVLFAWSAGDPALREWMHPHLKRLAKDTRKSVAKRAGKLLAWF